MKRISIVVLLMMVCASPLYAGKGKHLFILSGQSNMAALKPDQSFTPAVKKTFGKSNVIVVHDAQNGQPIVRWYKGWKGKIKGKITPGDLYDRLMVKVNTATEKQEIATVTFIWMQGESDASNKNSALYEESLKGLIKQLSTDLKRTDMHIVIGRVNDCANQMSSPGWQKIREVQVKVAEDLPSGDWVDTDDLNDPTNHIHANKDNYKTLGERFAKKAIGLIKKK